MARMFEFINYSKDDALLKYWHSKHACCIHLDKVQRRDIRNFNNPKSIEELSAITPVIDWKKFMTDMGVCSEQVLVMQPKYIAS